MRLDIKTVYIILIIPVFLALLTIMEGIKNLLSAKNLFFPGREELDDEAFLSGKQAGCLGVFYVVLGITFLLLIGYIYVFLLD